MNYKTLKLGIWFLFFFKEICKTVFNFELIPQQLKFT